MTKTKRKTSPWARRLGILAGLGVAAALVLSWRTPPGTGTLGLDLTATVQPTGLISFSPDGRLGAGRHMNPGDSIGGASTVRNLTGSALAVKLRALPSSRDLDGQLTATVKAGRRTVFTGPLERMIGAGAGRFELARGATAELTLRITLSSGAGTRAQGHVEDVVFEPVATPTGARP